MSDVIVWRIECEGGCGRVLETSKPSVLWSVTRCPDCREVAP